MPRRTDSETAALIDAVIGMAVHRVLGLTLVDRGPDWSHLRFEAGAAAQTHLGSVHGGVVALLLEPAAFAALVPQLDADEQAATVDLHVAFPNAPRPGLPVDVRGKVIRRARTLAFCEAEAWSDGRLCATARMTKAIFRPRG